MATMTRSSTGFGDPSLLSALLSGERFWPTEPQSLHEIGLSEPFLESLVCKLLLVNGTMRGRTIAADVCLPFSIIESILDRGRTRKLISHCGSGPLNEYSYALTEEGRKRARVYQQECAYVGPAPGSKGTFC